MNCEEARLFDNLPTGAALVDLDGSGPLAPVLLTCEMHADHGVMVVDHNLPNRTRLRTAEAKDHVELRIKYRHFTNEHLLSLVEMNVCSIQVEYYCRNAALK